MKKQMEFFFQFVLALICFCSFVVALGLILEHGFLDRFESIRNLRAAVKSILSLIDYFARSSKNRNEVNCVKNDTGESMSIAYTINGDKALINIPFDGSRQRRGKMEPWTVHLVLKTGSPINITQPSGIPYMCNATSLGGIQILAKNKFTEDIKTFDADIAPGWITEPFVYAPLRL
jgi:hypothetical protein